MAYSVFDDPKRPPTDAEVAAILGRTAAYWDELVAHMETRHPPIAREWGNAGKKWGWSLRLKQVKRNLLYLTPREGHFVVGTALGARAVKAALESTLAQAAKDAIEAAPKYAEGRGLRMEVRSKRHLSAAKRIAAFKVAF